MWCVCFKYSVRRIVICYLQFGHLFRALLGSQLVLGLIFRGVPAVIAAAALKAQEIRPETSAVAAHNVLTSNMVRCHWTI
jgi:hypothetical protein